MTKTAQDIKKIWSMLAKQIDGDKWVKITAVAEHLDVTPEQMSAAIHELIRSEPDFDLKGESNQKVLSAMDLLYRVRFAGDGHDLIRWI